MQHLQMKMYKLEKKRLATENLSLVKHGSTARAVRHTIFWENHGKKSLQKIDVSERGPSLNVEQSTATLLLDTPETKSKLWENCKKLLNFFQQTRYRTGCFIKEVLFSQFKTLWAYRSWWNGNPKGQIWRNVSAQVCGRSVSLWLNNGENQK